MDIPKTIRTIKQLYQEIETKNQIFKKVTGLNCIPGCGDCCNRFEPYITVLEGLILANYFEEQPQTYQRFLARPNNHDSDILCPFYNSNQDYHCGIYEVRPMICRLYSFSGKIESQGICFQPCPKIQEHFPKEVTFAQLLLKDNLEIPIYSEVYTKLCEIDFILATDFHPLTRSIEIALEQCKDIENETYQEKQKKLGQNKIVPFAQFVRNHILNHGLANRPLSNLTKKVE